MMQILDMEKEQPLPPLIRLAFRPLFLLGCGFAALSVLRWVLVLNGELSWQSPFSALAWHSHEMVYGFAMAIIVGFLLTAVQTWTGIPGFKGWPLAVMTAFWIAGRVVFWVVADASPWVYLLPDLLFMLTATIVLARPIFAIKQQRNMMFVPILALFCLLHLLQTWLALNGKPAEAQQVIRAAVWLVVMLIAIVGGRVIPFFTSRRWNTEKVLEPGWLVALAILPLAAIAALYAVGLDNSPVTRLLFGLAAVVHAIRVYRWWNKQNLREPLLWSLHCGYAAIPMALMIMAVAGKASFIGMQSFHLLAIGCIAGVILAMVARVSLGHTGRKLQAHRLMSIGFLLMFVSMLVRVFWPVLQPAMLSQSYLLSAGLFAVSLTIFYVLYFPVLTKPRVDGRPG